MQQLHEFLEGIRKFVESMKVDVCSQTDWAPTQINEQLCKARAYLNTLTAQELVYKAAAKIAQIDVSVLKGERDQAVRDALWGDNPVVGKNKDEREGKASIAIEQGGFPVEDLTRKENRLEALKGALDLLECARKNLNETRADLRTQLNALFLDRGIAPQERG